MELPELQSAIQKLLDDNDYQLEVQKSVAHPAVFHLLNKEATDLVLSTLKFDITIVKKK